MTVLLLSIVLLVSIYAIQKENPLLSGLLAVVPVKILATAAMAPDRAILIESISGMLIGQVAIAVALLIAWLVLRP